MLDWITCLQQKQTASDRPSPTSLSLHCTFCSVWCAVLAEQYFGVSEELVLRHLEVEWCGALSNASTRVVVRAVARTEPTAPVTRRIDRH